MKKKLCIAGIVLGLLMTLMGLKFALTGSVNYDGEIPGDYTFGADYYTEQYAATRDAAIDVVRVGNCMEAGFEEMFQISGFTAAIMGLIVSCYFGMQLADIKEKEKAVLAIPGAVQIENTALKTETEKFSETQTTEAEIEKAEVETEKESE